MASTFRHSGCIGDLLYALPTVQAFGSGELKVCNRPWTKDILSRLGSVAPFLELQPCVASVSIYHNGEHIDHDLSTFRSGGLKYGDTIIERQARWVHARADISKPWLFAIPDQRTKGKIVVNRCDRWVGFNFPWRELVEAFGGDMVFLGLPHEHRDFIRGFGHIDYLPTENLLEAASLIAGAELFMGNQSCPLAIAEGLHKRTIVECCCFALDCIYKRPGNVHCVDGEMSFDALGEHFESKAGFGDIMEMQLMARAKAFRDNGASA